jgi:hypothetical protein
LNINFGGGGGGIWSLHRYIDHDSNDFVTKFSNESRFSLLSLKYKVYRQNMNT